MIIMMAGGHPSRRTHRAFGLTSTPAALAPGVPVVALSPTGLREAGVMDAPGVAKVKVSREYSVTRRAAATSLSTAPSAIPMMRTKCQPPYFVDVDTDKLRWRLECL